MYNFFLFPEKKMDAPCFTYDNKIITVTHDMTLHITNCLSEGYDFQKVFSHNDENGYFLELMHIIFTKLISKVPDSLTFKLYVYQIPSSMVPYKFAKDAFEIVKPLIQHNEKTRYICERYFLCREEYDKSYFSLSSSEEEKEEHSMFELTDSDSDEEGEKKEEEKDVSGYCAGKSE